ncbi:hypothetical protein BU629_06050 [Staphylococcus capitis]|nr:hypothetical protein BU626_05775 [Staphylococcus capitis]PTH18853.1 hypothetical protein BU612_10575 [Staphylococcus capitis]RIM36477.1 hypothetical protein BU629_06050 [Staphylococcus capitis]RIM47746.1 hypothetical protein BU620_07070 [Staphylococcus capitis]
MAFLEIKLKNRIIESVELKPALFILCTNSKTSKNTIAQNIAWWYILRNTMKYILSLIKYRLNIVKQI